MEYSIYLIIVAKHLKGDNNHFFIHVLNKNNIIL